MTKLVSETTAELFANPPRDVTQWGKWRLRKASWELVHADGYPIDLETMTSSAEMLDWIFQITKKPQYTKDRGDLLQALQDIFEPQANLCSSGVDKKLDARAYLKQRYR